MAFPASGRFSSIHAMPFSMRRVTSSLISADLASAVESSATLLLSLSQNDQGVSRDDTLRTREERVDVEFGDFVRPINGQSLHRHDGFDKRLSICGRSTAHAAEH